jgi:nanoRNase/pAp phosphatase (c-di-AMP/oligoRNAs hydrolase)
MVYTKPCKEFTKEFSKLVSSSKTILITSHKSYDDDSTASVLAMYDYIHSKYPSKKVRIIYSGESQIRYKTFKNFKKIEFVKDIVDISDVFDLYIFLDGNRYDRFTNNPDELRKKVTRSICIDHHATKSEKFNLCLVSKKASSTSDIIFRCFFENINKKISKDISKVLLLGILGDTGYFKYIRPYQSNTFQVVRSLIDAGNIDLHDFVYSYNTIDLIVFEVIKDFIRNTSYKKVKGWPDFQISYISTEFKSKGKYNNNEIMQAQRNYLDNYVRSIEGYTWGIVGHPLDNGDCYISIRSLPGSVNSRIIAEKINLGGGHNRASGCIFKKYSGITVIKCIQKIIKWLNQNKAILD